MDSPPSYSGNDGIGIPRWQGLRCKARETLGEDLFVSMGVPDSPDGSPTRRSVWKREGAHAARQDVEDVSG